MKKVQSGKMTVYHEFTASSLVKNHAEVGIFTTFLAVFELVIYQEKTGYILSTV